MVTFQRACGRSKSERSVSLAARSDQDDVLNAKPPDIDAYLSTVPDDARNAPGPTPNDQGSGARRRRDDQLWTADLEIEAAANRKRRKSDPGT